MIGIETVIVIGTLAAGANLARPTKDVYAYSEQRREQRIEDLSTQVSWLAGGNRQQYLTPQASKDAPLLSAFSEIGLSRDVGLTLLKKAQEILASMTQSDIEVVPVVVRDIEEGQAYLTVRLLIDVEFETAMSLDYRLSEGMVGAFDRLPEHLSFEVYDRGSLAA